MNPFIDNHPLKNIVGNRPPVLPIQGTGTWNQQSILACVPNQGTFQFKVRLHMRSFPISGTDFGNLENAVPGGLPTDLANRIRIMSSVQGDQVALGYLVDDYLASQQTPWNVWIYSDYDTTKNLSFYIEVSIEAAYQDRILANGDALSLAISQWMTGHRQNNPDARATLAGLFPNNRAAASVLGL